MFDPFTFPQEALVCFLGVILVYLICNYWDRVVFALTGDDRIHVNCLDCWWSTIQCFGLCRCGWTRCLTTCPCCPRRFYGRSLPIVCGQFFGFASHTVELRNIIVGDLPFDKRGDFYLSVECQANPPMVTALQEKKLPKLVHFPEVITLRIRDSMLESRVRICVKELDVLGSNELCDIRINATSIVDWAHDRENMKRFKLRPLDDSIEREAPAWITLEFGEPEEVRQIDQLPDAAFSLHQLPVRTAVPNSALTMMPSNATRLGAVAAVAGATGSSRGMRTNADMNVTGYKHHYHLVDESGNYVSEMPEQYLARLHWLRNCVNCVFCFCNTIVGLLVVSWMIFRFYIHSCWRQFKWITMAYMNNAKFPISNAALHSIVKACSDKVEGAEITEGVPCRPNTAEILAICVNEPGGQRPRAFEMLIYNWFGIELKHGLPCFHGICKFRSHIVEYDRTIWIGCVCLVLFLCVLRFWLNILINRRRRRMQNEMATKQKKILAEMPA